MQYIKNLILIISLVNNATNFGMAGKQEKESELIELVKDNNLAGVAQLLKEGVSANVRSIFSGHPALVVACVHWDTDAEIIKSLLEHCADPDLDSPEHKETSLHCLASFYSYQKEGDKKVNLLLSYKANINSLSCDQQTPLIYAVKHANELIPLLLKNGAWLNHKDMFGETALSYAVQEGQLGSLHEILSTKFSSPNFFYGLNNSDHVLQLARNEYQKKVHSYQAPENQRKKIYQKIGKALIVFEGFCAGRSRISKEGLGKVLPLEIRKYIASFYDYKEILSE